MECGTESDYRVSELATLPYLQSILAQNDTYAVVSQDKCGNITISAEIGAGPGDLAVPPLVGGAGVSGVAQFPLRVQSDVYTSPGELLDEQPELTNTVADIGKYWLIDQQDINGNCISSAAYIWFGTEFRVLLFGPQGPPGPYPVIAPTVTLIGPNLTSTPDVPTGTGSAANPYLWDLDLSVPEGPQGPSATLASMGDVQETTPPIVGQFLGYNGSHTGGGAPIWQPIDSGDILPRPYTVPRGAFSSYAGITFSQTVTVATFSVPPNPFPWKPLVFGQIEMFGIELAADPLLIGAEVLLGDPTSGTLVARGFGNSLGGVVTLVPHCSTPGSPTTQMTPTNSVGLVAANAEAVLYVNLINDGIVALFDFQAAGAELFVMACAVTPQTPLPVPGALRTKVTLSAKTITLGS